MLSRLEGVAGSFKSVAVRRSCQSRLSGLVRSGDHAQRAIAREKQRKQRVREGMNLAFGADDRELR